MATHAACTSWPSSSASSTGATSRNGCSSARGSTAAAAALRPVGTDALRAEYEARGRDLAALQARLKRLDVVARQLDILWTYLDTTDEAGDEPGPMADDSPAAMSLRIVQAQEGERQRMAEDIHDGPAQVLTNAIFQVEYLDRILGDTDRAAHAEVAFLRDMLRNGLDEVRTFITDLRPPLVDVGMATALAERAQQLEERHGIVVEVSVDGHRRPPDADAARVGPAHRAGGAPERAQARGGQQGRHRPRGRSPRDRGQRSRVRPDAPGIGQEPQLRTAIHARARRADGRVSFRSSHDRGRAPASCSDCRGRRHDEHQEEKPSGRPRQDRRSRTSDAEAATARAGQDAGS